MEMEYCLMAMFVYLLNRLSWVVVIKIKIISGITAKNSCLSLATHPLRVLPVAVLRDPDWWRHGCYRLPQRAGERGSHTAAEGSFCPEVTVPSFAHISLAKQITWPHFASEAGRKVNIFKQHYYLHDYDLCL